MDRDYEDPVGPPPPWLHLLEPHWQAWREKQILKGAIPTLTSRDNSEKRVYGRRKARPMAIDREAN